MISLEHIRVGHPAWQRPVVKPMDKAHPLVRTLFQRTRENFMTPESVSERAGTSNTQFYHMRHGTMPTMFTMLCLGEALDLEMVWQEKAIPFIRHKA